MYGASGSGAVEGGGATLHPSQSLADLTSFSPSSTMMTSWADSGAGGGRHHPRHQGRQRSGSHAGLLDLPKDVVATAMGPKRLSSPNIALLADRISRAELSKLQRFAADAGTSGTRGRSAWDGRDSGSRGSSPRGSSDWSDHRRGSQLSLNIAGAVVGAESPYMSTPTEKGTPPNKNRYAPFPPSELAGGEASFFERGGESRRNSLRPFFSLGLETTSTTTATGAGRWDNEFSDTERFRAYSLQGDDSTVSVPTPEKGGGDVGGGGGGAGGSRTRLVQASPSLPELQAAKQRLRPKEGGNGSSSGSNGGGNYDLRRASLSPGHHQERSPRHSRSPSPVADAGTGHRRGSALDLRGSVSSPSPSNPPSLPPARPNRLMVKRYSVPDVLDGGDDFRHELTASEMFQQRRVSADVRPYDAIAGKIAASLLASPARSGDHHIPPLPPVPPPPPPLPSYSGGRVSSSSPNRSPSLRRKALETLGLTYSYGSNHSGSDGGGNDDEGSSGSNNSNISATVLTASDHQHSNNNISSRKVSLSRRSPVPSINITDYPDGPPEGPFSPDLDYPQNDLSLTASTTPTSSPSPNHLHQHHHLHPSPPGVSPTPSSQPSSPGGDHHYFKTVSEATSASYNIIGNTATINSSVGGVEGGGKVGELGRGGGGMDDTRSNNTDSGMEEGVGEDSTTWRPYDAFQVSERETEDESAFFREILKVLRLVLYLFIILSVLSGTLASRLSLFLLTSGISQDKQKEGESTVMLLLCICCPIVLNWFMAFVRILFGEKQWPTFSMLLFLLTVELLHTFGVCLLLFRVLPVLDFFRGITVTMATFQLPALLKLLIAERRLKLGACSFLKVLTSVLAFAAQVAAIVFFMVSPFPDDTTRETIPAGKVPEDTPHLSQLTWELPLALVLISLGWWENYTSGEWSLVGKVKVNMTLQQVQQVAQEVRDTATFLVAPFKVGMSVALGKYLNSTTFLLPDQSSGGEEGDSNPIMFHLDHYSLLYLQLGASLLVTYLASLACKLHMQKAAFAFPLLLSPLASLGIVYLQCHYQFIPGHWHMGVWVCPGAGEGAGGEGVDVGLLMLPMACAGALWISYCLVVSHIWFPRAERMAKVEKLFVTPHFDAIFPDFHLTCRRRRNDHELRASHLDQLSSSEEEGGSLPRCPRAEKGSQGDDESTPRIFVCATMWHETQREMTQLLKSLFRLDYVHCASKLAQDKFDIKDPDYYDLEIHVIFDDAFDLDDDVDRFVPNIFVRKMIECMEDAARSVLKGPIDIPPPVKTTTPYGGQLVWTMPGQTQMYVHLKNKNLIRHRKRWSQCMYLYYLLGFRLLGGKNDGQSDTMSDCGEADTKHETTRHRGGKHKTKTRTQRRKKASMPLRSLLGHMEPEKYEKTVQMSENTFILTLDGDVDFKPDSVRLLLDRMKKNKKVGAVCGRIHPIGSGPMVWYQQFEYAIGHWLQKASEHVFGCVLCCPGCFSLFRGSALMDDNVMKKYTTKPTEASHFIQFEQGEDRWLCTLLLQQGHRIDYSAGADALTFAPETFNEFFNQRRRWSPSTLANMMDLLSTWRETVGINDNISRLYILYQFMLMASSILAPSTVVLMITGSYNSVLGISMWWSFVLSLTPVVFYLAVCLTQKNDMQIKIGAVLTALYTVVMMIATVGTLISIATESFNSPNVVFLTGLFIIFLVASLLHPQEFFCLVYGSLYFLVVPSTFILLTVYYLCNLNNVSWGTREVPKKLSPEEEEAQKVAEQERAQSKNKSSKSLFSLYGVVSLVHELSEAVRGLWGLREELKQQKGATATGSAGGGTAEEAHHHDDVEKAVTSQSVVAVSKKEDERRLLSSPKPPIALPRRSDDTPPGHEPNPESPHWLGLDYLGYGMVNTLRDEEREFWKFLIGKYLHPLEEDKSHKAKIAEDLIIIRNNVVLIYVMMNFLWCVIALQLQSMEGSLKMFYIVEKYEPLSLVFLSIFALVLMLQFLSMLVHRWGTFLHLMATTRIDWCKKSFSEEEFARYVVNQTKILQNMEPSPDYNDDGDGDVDIDDDGDSFYNRSSYGDVEEGGMSLVDFHPSLQEDPHKGPGGASSFNVNHGRASGAGAGRVGAEEDQGGIYETLSRRPPLPFRPQYPHPQYPYQPYPGQLQRSTSTTGQFPLLKTIFEQKLTQLQHRYQQRAASLSRQQGRALNRGTTGGGFGFGVGGSQQRYWGAGDRRHGDMRQRFVHQNFQLPPTSATRAASGTGAARLFRGENGVDIV